MLINDLECYERSTHYTGSKCGMDDPSFSLTTKKEWNNSPVQNFDYRFNSWGFRGPDYEQYIGQPVNICLGDSFTVNIGGPIEHSWCDRLALHYPIPTINLGMDGAGNDAISLLYYRACDLFDVQFTFVMYSYFHRRLRDGKFIQDVIEDEDNFDYFLRHRIPHAIECAIPSWNYSKQEQDFLQELDIFYVDAPTHYSPNNKRSHIFETSYNNLRGPDWPTLEQFQNGAEAHPDMLTERFGGFLSHQGFVNRDGHHNNLATNKIYADYFYQQWKATNES